MKRFRKFIGAFVCAVVLVTTVFSMAAFAMDTGYSVNYSSNIETLVETTIEQCVVGAVNTDPKGRTVPAQVEGYEFDKWVEKGKDSLPVGWITSNNGLTISFDPNIEGAERKAVFLVAMYKSIEIKPGPVLDSDSEETEKIASVDKKDIVDKTDVTKEDETLEVAKTGDINNSFVWILIGAIALVAIIAVVIFMLKDKK